MRLTLYRKDLKEGKKKINCEEVTYNDFKSDVQKVIKIVGEAIFYDYIGHHSEPYKAIDIPE